MAFIRLNVNYIREVIKRKPLKENCDCPNCNHKLNPTELSNKQCSICTFIFRTNLHDEPIIIGVPEGKEIRNIVGYMPRKSTRLPYMEPVVFKDNSCCPYCDAQLSIDELNARYCRRCYNTYHVTPAGEPIIVEIDITQDAKSRIEINYK